VTESGPEIKEARYSTAGFFVPLALPTRPLSAYQRPPEGFTFPIIYCGLRSIVFEEISQGRGALTYSPVLRKGGALRHVRYPLRFNDVN